MEPYEKHWVKEEAEELKNSGNYIDNVEITERSINIVKDEIKDIYHEINRMTDFDLVDVYKKLFENLEFFLKKSNTEYHEKNIDEMKSYTLEALRIGKLNYEDQPPLLYLKGALGDLPKTQKSNMLLLMRLRIIHRYSMKSFLSFSTMPI